MGNVQASSQPSGPEQPTGAAAADAPDVVARPDNADGGFAGVRVNPGSMEDLHKRCLGKARISDALVLHITPQFRCAALLGAISVVYLIGSVSGYFAYGAYGGACLAHLPVRLAAQFPGEIEPE